MQYKQEFEKPVTNEDFYKQQLEQSKYTLKQIEKNGLNSLQKEFVIDEEEAIQKTKDSIAYFESKLGTIIK